MRTPCPFLFVPGDRPERFGQAGAVSLDGEMLDKPLILRAQALLASA